MSPSRDVTQHLAVQVLRQSLRYRSCPLEGSSPDSKGNLQGSGLLPFHIFPKISHSVLYLEVDMLQSPSCCHLPAV